MPTCVGRAGGDVDTYSEGMRRITQTAVAVASLVLVTALAACAPSPTTAAPSSPPPTSPPPSAPTPSAPASATPAPAPTEQTVARLPSDCRAILSADVLAQLKDVPLNDPAFGPSGVQADGSLLCVWGSPNADTTSLVTKISRVNRGPALDQLNAFRDKGATCYTPENGTRCEQTWQNKRYPVTDGRTMFWRAGVLIDTQYSNLAPTGYTSSIVAHVYG